MKTARHYITAIIIVIALILSLISGAGFTFAAAATSAGSPVMDDLRQDENFDSDDYPIKNDDYSIKVIQIAETTDGGLLIYTYQPGLPTMSSLKATKINMSLSEQLSNENTSYKPTGYEFEEFTGKGGGAEGSSGGGGGGGGAGGRAAVAPDKQDDSTYLYDLKLVNSFGVFAKYRVKDFKIKDDEKRFYNISTIYRDFNVLIDEPATDGNVINAVAYEVGQLWTVTTSGNDVKYEVKEIEVVNLLDQYIGMRRYNDGVFFENTKGCDSHYIAFTCDHKIDYLLNADLEFHTRSYYESPSTGGKVYSDALTYHRTTLYNFIVSNAGGGWFGKVESWHRLTSIENFKKEVTLTADENAKLSNFDWIINFYESEYVVNAGGKDVLISGLLPFGFIWSAINANTVSGEIVTDVALLRLEFKYNGKIYNLGVVSDIQTGSNKPTNTRSIWEIITDFFKANPWIWAVIAAVVVVALIILGIVFPAFGRIEIFILKKIGLLISAPFRAIGKAIARRRERKREEAKTLSKAESKKKKKGKSNGKKAKQNKSKKAAGKRGKK